MKKIIFLLLPLFIFCQKENDNWIFGDNHWKFDQSQTNGFTHFVRNPYIRYISSVISDKTSGELLFYCDGNNIYNKQHNVMDNGNSIFGTSTAVNSSDQSSIILPLPGSTNIYYVFHISGNRSEKDQYLPNMIHNYGLRYSKVDMNLNGGLGRVISKNNILINNSPINALTSTFGHDGLSYWIITLNTSGQFVSFKLDNNGPAANPVVSGNNNYGNFIKISPDSRKVITRSGQLMLSNFDNSTGVVSASQNILPPYSDYIDGANNPNSAEFSGDSNIIYFILSKACLCVPPTPWIGASGIGMYNISSNQLVGSSAGIYDFPIPAGNSHTASLQRATNGKIYLLQNYHHHMTGTYRIVDFEQSVGGINHSFKWAVINNPDQWNISTNPVVELTTPFNVKNGFSFPQLVPINDKSDICTPNIMLTGNETHNNYFYRAGNFILMQSDYFVNGNNLTMTAGDYITMLPNTTILSQPNTGFSAYIEGCSENPVPGSAKVLISPNKTDKQKLNILYPNPAFDYLHVNINSKIKSAAIYDMSGKMLKVNFVNGAADIRDLAPGVYTVQLETEAGKIVDRFIKK